jgi:hypothetical protein
MIQKHYGRSAEIINLRSSRTAESFLAGQSSEKTGENAKYWKNAE